MMNTPNSRRCKIFFLTLNRLVKVLEGKLEIVGFPEDSIFLSINAGWTRNCVEILVCSETFDEVPEGQIPPQLEIDDISYKVVEAGVGKNKEPIAVKGNAIEIELPDERVKFREFI